MVIQPFDIYIDILKDGAEVVSCHRDGNYVFIDMVEHTDPDDNFLMVTKYMLGPGKEYTWVPLERIYLEDME